MNLAELEAKLRKARELGATDTTPVHALGKLDTEVHLTTHPDNFALWVQTSDAPLYASEVVL